MEFDLKFAYIPPGTFDMGGDAADAEKPIRPITISRGFHMSVTPITQAQWSAVTGSNPSHFKGDDRPVETVSWDNADAYCRELAKLTGKPIRLPTEAEWEYACRGGGIWYEGGSLAQALGTAPTPARKHILSANSRRMVMGCMICWATSGNGVPIGMMITTTSSLRGAIRKVRKTVAPGCCVAARGTMMKRMAALPSATGTRRVPATITTGSACVSAWTD